MALSGEYLNRAKARVAPYEAQIENLNKDYDLARQRQETNNARALNEAYIGYQQAKRNMPQQLAAYGLAGGLTETAAMDMQNSYGRNRLNQEQLYTDTIADLELQQRNKVNDLNALIASAYSQAEAEQQQAEAAAAARAAEAAAAQAAARSRYSGYRTSSATNQTGPNISSLPDQRYTASTNQGYNNVQTIKNIMSSGYNLETTQALLNAYGLTQSDWDKYITYTNTGNYFGGRSAGQTPDGTMYVTGNSGR